MILNSRPLKRTLPMLALAVTCGGAVTGCAEYSLLSEPGDAAFGEANRQTMMAQVIDPEPVYTEDATTNGETGAAAVERYREGNVKQPDTIRTTNVGDAGSSDTPD